MKTGMVLEGGAMRGLFTAGVLDVFMENQIEVDGLVGVSAGACFGCNYKSRQIDRSIRYNLRFCKDQRYGTIASWLKYGDLYEPKLCYHDIPLKYDLFDVETFCNNPVKFYVTCTNVDTGEPYYYLYDKSDEHDMIYMQASASMPIVSRVVEVDGLRLLDGGVTDSIPIEWFRSIGYEKNIVIQTRPEGYRKKNGGFTKAQCLLLHKYPNLAKAVEMRSERYNHTLDVISDLEKKGEVLVIRPSETPDVSRTEHDPAKLQALYDLGRRDAEKKLDEVRAFLDI
ncbi:MAG: patatin family protein [Lachnospiraceae bacterium]|nr:patatin family protein [Lachnospiraceae bacterium]